MVDDPVTYDLSGTAEANVVTLTVTGTTTPAANGALVTATGGLLNSKRYWTTGGVPKAYLDDAGSGVIAEWTGSAWTLKVYAAGTPNAKYWSSAETVASPDLVVTWTGQSGPTGTPVFARTGPDDPATITL